MTAPDQALAATLPSTAPIAAAPAPAPSSPTSPAAAPTPAQPHLVESLTRLRSRADGNHELSIALHPAELGAVHVRATLHNGTLTVTVACADDAARQAVTAALPDLHHALGGLGSIDVDPRDAGQRQDQASTDRSPEQQRDPSGSAEQDGGSRQRQTRQDPDGLDQWM